MRYKLIEKREHMGSGKSATDAKAYRENTAKHTNETCRFKTRFPYRHGTKSRQAFTQRSIFYWRITYPPFLVEGCFRPKNDAATTLVSWRRGAAGIRVRSHDASRSLLRDLSTKSQRHVKEPLGQKIGL